MKLRSRLPTGEACTPSRAAYGRRTLKSMLRLALLDDHAAVLAGLKRLIAPQPDMTVIAAAPTVAELSQQLNRTSADVFVLDFDVARGDGLMHCLRLKRRSRPPAVVIYSAYCGHGLVLAARAAGADRVVDKSEPVENLLAAIRGAAVGDVAMPAVPRTAYEAAVAALDDEDLPVLAMLLDRESLDGMAQALRKSRAELSWRSQRIVARLRPILKTRPGSARPARDELSKLS